MSFEVIEKDSSFSNTLDNLKKSIIQYGELDNWYEKGKQLDSIMDSISGICKFVYTYKEFGGGKDIVFREPTIFDKDCFIEVSSFIADCKDGSLMDDDGYGKLVINGKLTDIVVLPSAVMNGSCDLSMGD